MLKRGDNGLPGARQTHCPPRVHEPTCLAWALPACLERIPPLAADARQLILQRFTGRNEIRDAAPFRMCP